MACSHPIVEAADGEGNGGCCETAQSICDWLVVHSNGWLQFGGCYGQSKTLTAGTVSIHTTGRAIDVNVYRYRIDSPQNAACKFLLDTYVTPNACTLGIQRLVFEGRQWTSGMDNTLKFADWPLAPTTMLHTTALHIEVTPELCGKFRYQDVNAVMVNTASLIYIGGKAGDPVNPQVETLAPSPSGNGADGTAVGGGIEPQQAGGSAENQLSDTNPVWSSVTWELGACAACGAPFSTQLARDVIQQTHCGGTGAICIIKDNGQTCSAGTAPSIGNFPGAIRDFIWWGDGGYGLSRDGMTVYALGDAIEPVFEQGSPEEKGPWERILGVGPSTIAVSKNTPFGQRSLRATVNSIADYACCAPAEDAPSAGLALPFALYNYSLDGNTPLLQNRGTSGDVFNATWLQYPSCPTTYDTWTNDHGPTPVTDPALPTIYTDYSSFGGDWCSGGVTAIIAADVSSTDLDFISVTWQMYDAVSVGAGTMVEIEFESDPITPSCYVRFNIWNTVLGAGKVVGFTTNLLPYVQSGVQNTIVVTVNPSIDPIFDSYAAWVNGTSIPITSASIGSLPSSCSELTGNPALFTFPAAYGYTEVRAWRNVGTSCDWIESGGIAVARGTPNEIDLDYWQQFDWSGNEGFAP